MPENPKCKDCSIYKFELPELWCKNGCVRTDGDLIQKLREFIVNHGEDGSCPFDSMNEGQCHEYLRCSLCIFDHAVDSRIKGDPPICKDCGDLAVCDGMCQYPSRTEQIKANERNKVLDALTNKLIEEIIIDGTTEFVTFRRHAISTAIDSLRKGVK
jgi:hypothetical protein